MSEQQRQIKVLEDYTYNFDYNPETGIVTWKKGRFKNQVAGTWLGNGYLGAQLHNKRLLMHRVAYAIYHDKNIEGFIDHINGKRDDNRICNLRVVTAQQNQFNRKANYNSTCEIMGVYYDVRRYRWNACIQVDKKTKHLGSFKCKLMASIVRHRAELRYGYTKSEN